MAEGMRIGSSAEGLAESVYGQVKARILSGSVRPGEVMAAHQIAAELAVSRTPVHEALKRLVTQGYLITQPRIGYTVTPVNIDELRDLFQVRIRLECLAAELAAEAFNDEHARAFERANQDAKALSRRLAKRPNTDPLVIETVTGLHRQFHEMIADVAGNQRLRALIGALQEETQRFWALMPGWPAIQYTFLNDPGHQEIYDAVASKDPAKAREAVAHHMRDGLRVMLETMLPPSPPPAEKL